MKFEEAEWRVVLSRSKEGRLHLDSLAKEFDTAMKKLLYADKDEVLSVQGQARALHEQLQKFSDAHTIVNKEKT